jgi:hypothetical protein
LKTAHLTVQEFAVAAIHIVLDPAKTRYLALRFQGRRLPDFEQSLSPRSCNTREPYDRVGVSMA